MKNLFRIISVFVLFTSLGDRSIAQEQGPTEYQVKAAFLYNFAKFIDWPSEAFPDSSNTFTIGVVGKDPFGIDLDDIAASKTIKGKCKKIKRSGKIIANLK